MKRLSLLLTTLTILFLAACGTAVPTPEIDPNFPPEGSQGDPRPTATIDREPAADDATATADPDAYPAQMRIPPTATPYPEGYVVATVPPRNPYPADEETGFVWIIRPFGEQCAETNEFASLDEVVAALEGAGISTRGREVINLNVTAACGSPTSEHYRVEIPAQFQRQAESLGWTVEQ